MKFLSLGRSTSCSSSLYLLEEHNGIQCPEDQRIPKLPKLHFLSALTEKRGSFVVRFLSSEVYLRYHHTSGRHGAARVAAACGRGSRAQTAPWGGRAGASPARARPHSTWVGQDHGGQLEPRSSGKWPKVKPGSRPAGEDWGWGG